MSCNLTPPDQHTRSTRRHVWFHLVLFGLVVVLLVTQLASIRQAAHTLHGVRTGPLAWAALAYIGTICAATTSYYSLSRPRSRYAMTLAVQVASGFVNRLLPAGLGGLGIFIAYFRHCRYTLPVATAVVAANNALGFIGNAVLVVAVFATGMPFHIRSGLLPSHRVVYAALAGVIMLAVVWLSLGRRSRRLHRSISQIWIQLRRSLRPRPATFVALSSNIILTVLMATILSLAASAVGSELSWPAALLVITLGTALGAATPTPGGLGGVEAGLMAGLIGFGLEPATALSTALLYRVITYWSPIIPGIVVYKLIERRILA